ncbi:MAG: aminopeptidase P family N-terminal domain-containing protein, partial [Longicatena sp.]
MTIIEKLKELRRLMDERNISVYMIPTSDFHETEYVGEYFKARYYMSGFSGSAGTLVVCKECAALWTDGRYFIQAAKQLENSTIELIRQGEEGVPTIAQYIYDHMKEKEVFGFDGRVMNTKLTKAILGKLKEKEVGVSYDEDLVDMIWKDRPTLPKAKAFFLTEAFSGKSVGDKLKEIREEMNQKHATHHIITSLDDIAWILNMRGGDVECYPVALSYLVLTHNENYLFIDADKLTNELYQEFKANNIVVKDYDAIYDFVKTIEEGSTILLDSGFVNYAITQNLKDNIKLVDCTNPSQMMKAIKNPVELENNKIAHIRDGVAMTKFMYWLKTNVG